ncbi:MAG TPA: protein kinase [Thermoanaerobaculia bacterium]|nr:protein kinase [Thermoanaerobaculia bacterium]
MQWQPRPEDAGTSADGPRSPSLPDRIGVYSVQGRLGRGGMGEVFLAWDERLERRVAIKRIRQDSDLSPEQRERFRREARMAARLSHSAIVQIHDLVTEGDEDAIVMEYVEGRTLAQRLAGGRLKTAEALRLSLEIATGLAAAHEAGLIHRDLKSANVIVTGDGHAKILDFGLARPMGLSDDTSLTRQGIVVGTLLSMSPEQARGLELDERSDLFSLGVLLYEMLAGRSPFQGKDPVEVLHRVVYEPPPNLRSLRPDLAPELESLLDRLLAKDRQLRPGSAREVIAALESLPASLVAGAAGGTDSLSDLPTSAEPRWQEPVPAVRSHRRTALAGAAVVLLAAVAAAAWLGRPAAPLRVAVARPEVRPAAGDEQLGLAASGVLAASLSGLAALEDIAPVDPREASRGGTSPVEMAHTAAADEVLIATLEREGGLARVSLRRVRGNDGAVLWTETFRVPSDPGSLPLLADAVSVRLRRAYPGHDPRPGAPALDVRDEDYAAFLEIRQRIDQGGAPLAPELARLEEVIRRSPRFLEGQILAARVAHSLYQTGHEPADLDRASRLVRQSLELAPDDPRPLLLEVRIALAAGREEQAEELLGRIDRLLPGDPEVLPLKALLAEQKGRPFEALEALRAAAEQVPSWQNLYRLAALEAKLGHIEEARERIAEILRQAPDNLWAREQLGHLELLYGDLARAEQIYLDSVRVAPDRAWHNLGVVRFLRGRYPEAAVAYRRALENDPGDVASLLNLADTEVELGHREEAEALYRRALALLAESAPEDGLGPRESIQKAQCLARLGRTREAVEIAQDAVRRSPDEPQILLLSAFVHHLAGDRSSALNNAQAALEKGIQPRWFTGSAFRSLREDPELRPLLQPAASP